MDKSSLKLDFRHFVFISTWFCMNLCQWGKKLTYFIWMFHLWQLTLSVSTWWREIRFMSGWSMLQLMLILNIWFKLLLLRPFIHFLTRIFIIISPVLTTLLIISSNKKQSWIKVSRFDQKMMLSPLHFLFIRLLGDYSGLVNDNSGWMTRLNLNLIFIFECNYEWLRLHWLWLLLLYLWCESVCN